MEWADLTRIFFALIAVLGLIGLMAAIARKVGLSSGGVSFSSRKRLSTVETMAIDARRRVAIIKCDDREHLVLLSANGETLIETNLPPAPMEEAAQEPRATTFGEAMEKLNSFKRGTNPFAEKYAREQDHEKETDAA